MDWILILKFIDILKIHNLKAFGIKKLWTAEEIRDLNVCIKKQAKEEYWPYINWNTLHENVNENNFLFLNWETVTN